MKQLLRKNYLGIDVSKPWFDVSLMVVLAHVKQPILTERFDNSAPGFKAFKIWLKSVGVSLDENSLLVIENTGVYHRQLWSFCSKYNLPLHIGNAAHIKWSLGITRGKSDVIDSVRLCQYCCKQSDELKATPALNPVFMKLKDLMTSRSRLVVQLHSTKNYIKELKCSNDKLLLSTLEKAHKAAIEGIKKSIEQIEEMINKIVQEDLSVREVENLVKNVSADAKPKQQKISMNRDVLALQNTLSEKIGAVVSISAKTSGAGTLKISYSSLDQLDDIIAKISR